MGRLGARRCPYAPEPADALIERAKGAIARTSRKGSMYTRQAIRGDYTYSYCMYDAAAGASLWHAGRHGWARRPPSLARSGAAVASAIS